jgi:hypothetical protein
MDSISSDFKTGDWIILKDEYTWRSDYAIEILKVDEKEQLNTYNTYVSSRGLKNYVNPNFYRLATEFEIKKEKIRRTFRT